MSDLWLHIKKLNNVEGIVYTNHPTIMNSLYNFFNVFAEGYRFMPKYKAGVWDGKIPFLKRNGTFPLGLARHVYRFCQQDGLEIIVDPQITNKNEIDEDHFNTIIDKWMTEEINPRDYQLEGSIKACIYQRGILEHATSAGKSLTMSIICMYNIITDNCKKILVLVPSLGLVEQLSNDFIEYGVPPDWIGKFSGLEKNTEEKIIISTWQSMHKQGELIKEFEGIIGDECHSQKANVVRSIAERAVNCKLRIGCTGSMPDEKSNKWLIEGTFGPVLHQVTAKFLIDHEYAADIRVRVPFIIYPDEIKEKLKGIPYDMEKKWLEECPARNKLIKKLTEKHVEKGHNILILADHLDHIDTIEALINEIPGAKVYKVTGEVDAREREKLRKFTNENEKVVLVASYGVFSTGISIKRLHAITFASAGKSKIKTMQSIGRGMRLHKDKDHVVLYDIGDDLKYSKKHLLHRVTIYEKSQFNFDMFEVKF